MARAKLEIANILHTHGPAWRQANKGYVSLSHLKAMSSIEACRAEARSGNVAACSKCDHQRTAYNSCKNRYCRRSQSSWCARRHHQRPSL
ncbi:MAG: transposase zinc-binding domain-containing protein [Planktotalea arctica]